MGQRGQHEGRRREPLAAQPGEQVETVDGREPTVEQEDVVVAGQSQVESSLSVGSHVDDVPLVLEQLHEHRGQLRVVLDEQQPRTGHRPRIGSMLSRRLRCPATRRRSRRRTTRPRRRCARSARPGRGCPRRRRRGPPPRPLRATGRDRVPWSARCHHQSAPASTASGTTHQMSTSARCECSSMAALPPTRCSRDSPEEVLSGVSTAAASARASGPQRAQARKRGHTAYRATARAAVGTTTTVACTMRGWTGSPSTVSSTK